MALDFSTMISVVSTIFSHNLILLLSILNTLICLLFIFLFSSRLVIHHVRLNNARFITSFLIILVQVLIVILSRSFSTHLASYALGFHPPLLLAFWFYLQRTPPTSTHVQKDSSHHHPLQVHIQEALIPKKFDIKYLKAATSNFKDPKAVNHFCDIFVAALDGKPSAIMRIKCPKDRRTYTALVNEISTISLSRHDNIVRLLGYCLAPDFVYFAYEYMENHRVLDWIYDNDANKRRTLSLARRYQVGIDVAKALDYLNSHRKNYLLDVSPNNTLLDGTFKAKVTDFGLWRLLEQTKGQLDNMFPSFSGSLDKSTVKRNVYRYGVFLLELLSAEKHWPQCKDGEIMSILYCKLKEGKHLEFVDHALEMNDGDEEKVLNLLKVALMCVQLLPENRPSMGQVVAMLAGLEPVPSLQQIHMVLMMSNHDFMSSPADDFVSPSCDDEIHLCP